jgi:hypothetical protein
MAIGRPGRPKAYVEYAALVTRRLHGSRSGHQGRSCGGFYDGGHCSDPLICATAYSRLRSAFRNMPAESDVRDEVLHLAL